MYIPNQIIIPFLSYVRVCLLPYNKRGIKHFHAPRSINVDRNDNHEPSFQVFDQRCTEPRAIS